MLDLYFSPGSCALASHIALEEAGADYRAHRIDFAANEQQSLAFLKVNPKGRVPALATPMGILTESPAMLVYIAQTHPAAGLAPMDDAFAFARLQAVMSYLCSTLHVAHAHRQRGRRWADDDAALEAMRRKVPQSVGDAFAYLEDHAFEGPFVMGASYTVADPYLFTMARWMEGDGVDPARFPKIRAHREAMRARPAVRAALRAEGLAE